MHILLNVPSYINVLPDQESFSAHNKHQSFLWQPIYPKNPHNLCWRLQIETFSALPAFFFIPITKASDADFWCLLWSTPEQRLSKQSRRRWFKTSLHSLWRHCNARQGRFMTHKWENWLVPYHARRQHDVQTLCIVLNLYVIFVPI